MRRGGACSIECTFAFVGEKLPDIVARQLAPKAVRIECDLLDFLPRQAAIIGQRRQEIFLRTALELEGPAAALHALGAARVLEDAVERDELRYDDPAHGN